MRFYHRALDRPRRLGVLPGSFNPLTIAHLHLIQAAGPLVDEVLCVVPRSLPHKDYFGATLEQRVGMLESAGLTVPHSIADSDQSLFIDIARQCRLHYGDNTRLLFLCGRDAAERIMTWDYGRPGVVEEMLREFELLVAPRGGRFTAPQEFQDRVHVLDAAAGHDQVSSTEVRERIARAEPWEHLVPNPIVDQVRRIYS
jgi:nicotinate (nicotinamide) nucleotide adenylyltransferase